MAIFFYSVNEEYGCFSNFYKSTFELDGKIWTTVEHYYQAMKFDGYPEVQEEIRVVNWAGRTKRLANGKYRDLWEWNKWKRIRDNIMFKALLAKYFQNSDLAEMLLATGNEELIEHTKKDKYWADGGDGSGKNRLGQLLMNVREELKEKYC